MTAWDWLGHPWAVFFLASKSHQGRRHPRRPGPGQTTTRFKSLYLTADQPIHAPTFARRNIATSRAHNDDPKKPQESRAATFVAKYSLPGVYERKRGSPCQL